MELATDLVSLALYDIVIFADDSGSMIFEEGGDRVDDLKLIVGRVAEVGTTQMIHAAGTRAVLCGRAMQALATIAVGKFH